MRRGSIGDGDGDGNRDSSSDGDSDDIGYVDGNGDGDGDSDGNDDSDSNGNGNGKGDSDGDGDVDCAMATAKGMVMAMATAMAVAIATLMATLTAAVTLTAPEMATTTNNDRVGIVMGVALKGGQGGRIGYLLLLSPLVPCTLIMYPGIKNLFLIKKTCFLVQIFNSYLGIQYGTIFVEKERKMFYSTYVESY